MPLTSRFDLLEHRKLFRSKFETERIELLRAAELLAARRLLRRLLDSSVNYARDLQLYVFQTSLLLLHLNSRIRFDSTTADVILSVTYGITPKSEDDYFVQLAESLVGALTEVARAPYLGKLVHSLV